MIGFGRAALITSMLAIAPFSAQAQQVPLPDKPFAEHRIVLQY